MSAQAEILRACTHEHRPCEVNLGTNRKREVIHVCCECWNMSVAARLDERKTQLSAHWQQYRDAQAVAMREAGQQVGQRVSYFCRSLLGIGGYTVAGVIALNRNGVAVIRLDRPQDGGKHSTEWTKGWRVIA